MENTQTDVEYWEQFTQTYDEDGMPNSTQNHDISLNILVKFKDTSDTVVFETRERDINCNLEELETWFSNLKKTIRMVDETYSDKGALF